MKRVAIVIILLITIKLVGCSSSSMEGIILEVTENEIMFSENLSNAKYEKIKDKSFSEIIEDEQGIPLIFLTYEKADEFTEGDEVEVWIDGPILESYPAQAKAKKIVLKK